MKEILIPLLNLTIHMNPVAFSAFGVPVYWYAILIVASIVLALFMYYKNDGKFGIHYADVIDLAIILIPISFLCARMYYVLFNLEYYTTLEKIIHIKDGGLAIYGGILGGIATAYIFCQRRNISFFDLADYLIPYLSLRTSNWQMGKFYQWGSLWKHHKSTMENGNQNRRNHTICTPNLSI